MSTTATVPTDSAGLMELLSDHKRLGGFFSQEAGADGTTQKFLDAYAGHYVKKNPDAVDDANHLITGQILELPVDAKTGRRNR